MNALLKQSRYISRALMVGMWFTNKYQLQARDGSVFQSAKNLRKSGCPIEIALLILSVRG
jgi:hypothetical protein